MKRTQKQLSVLLLVVILLPELSNDGHFLLFHHHVKPVSAAQENLWQTDTLTHCPYLEHKFYPVSEFAVGNYHRKPINFCFYHLLLASGIPEITDRYSYLLRGPPMG